MEGIPVKEEQVEYAKQLAREITEDKQESGFEDRSVELEKTWTGFLGEVVYADHYDRERPDVQEGKLDAGYDFRVDGRTVEVKTTTYTEYPVSLLIFPRHREKYEICDEFALVKIDLNKMIADIVVQVSTHYFFNHCYKKDFGHGDRLSLRFQPDRDISIEQETYHSLCRRK